MSKIEEAKKTLEDAGYQTYNLWHIDDVKHHYDCTDEEAMSVLISALQNEATMEQIWFAIHHHAEEDQKLKEKDN